MIRRIFIFHVSQAIISFSLVWSFYLVKFILVNYDNLFLCRLISFLSFSAALVSKAINTATELIRQRKFRSASIDSRIECQLR